MELRNSHVFVVGGSTGVGAAFVRRLSKEGAKVTVLALAGEELEAIGAETGAATIAADLSDLAGLEGMIGRAEELNGPVNALFCIAAICPSGAFQNYTAETIQRSITINLTAHMELIRQVVPGMIERGAGTIGVIGSLSSEVGMIHLGCYVPSKAALKTFATDLDSELRGYGIRVFSFTLGSVKGTPLATSATEDPVVAFLEKRAGGVGVLTPEVVADRMTQVLASDRKGAAIAIPRSAQPLVTFRGLPGRLMDPLLGRTARKFKRQSESRS